jgi:hypothetical protein
MPSPKTLLRHTVLSLFSVPILGIVLIDLLNCVQANATLRSAAEEAAYAGLHVLGDGADQTVIATALARARALVGAAADVEITAEIGADRRSVSVSIHRPGLLCWSQVVGLSENRDGLALARRPDPAERTKSTSDGCPIASFIPC